VRAGFAVVVTEELIRSDAASIARQLLVRLAARVGPSQPVALGFRSSDFCWDGIFSKDRASSARAGATDAVANLALDH
jgi:hypothetical protein